MYEFKVVITKNEIIINQLLKEGWFIQSITAQHVAGTSVQLKGDFCFLLKK